MVSFSPWLKKVSGDSLVVRTKVSGEISSCRVNRVIQVWKGSRWSKQGGDTVERGREPDGGGEAE